MCQEVDCCLLLKVNIFKLDNRMQLSNIFSNLLNSMNNHPESSVSYNSSYFLKVYVFFFLLCLVFFFSSFVFIFPEEQIWL